MDASPFALVLDAIEALPHNDGCPGWRGYNCRCDRPARVRRAMEAALKAAWIYGRGDEDEVPKSVDVFAAALQAVTDSQEGKV